MELNRKGFILGTAAALLAAAPAQARNKPITVLPHSNQRRFAWTIDDGVSHSAIASYLNFASKYDQHLTFFVTSCYPSWKQNKSQIKDLLSQGKIQLGNHTLSHKDLTSLTDQGIRNQLLGCHNFLLDEFGYDARPYFRPTYGYWDKRVLSVASDIGYTVPTMWFGTLGDVSKVSEVETLKLANEWLVNGRIVVDHANTLKSSNEMLRILEIMKARKLKSVTLREAFGKNFK